MLSDNHTTNIAQGMSLLAYRDFFQLDARNTDNINILVSVTDTLEIHKD